MSKENAVEERSVDEDLNILVEELSEGPDACCKGGFYRDFFYRFWDLLPEDGKAAARVLDVFVMGPVASRYNLSEPEANLFLAACLAYVETVDAMPSSRTDSDALWTEILTVLKLI